ncbi:MAG: YbaB/EbfC family nucleoid-associated protein [Candidatus Omnitrophica bacterium]|nr:YbaB/EbfC family nucleoid-associated protein [Candidatus Omnitrophota bacterium]
MLKGLGDLANIMKNAKDIQSKVEEMKNSLAELEVEGLGGGGLVRIKGKGDGTITSLTFDEATFAKSDKQLMEDLTLAAFNNFNEKLNEKRKEKISEVTGGLGLPAGMDFGL